MTWLRSTWEKSKPPGPVAPIPAPKGMPMPNGVPAGSWFPGLAGLVIVRVSITGRGRSATRSV